MLAYRTARRDLKKGIKDDKGKYRQRIEGHFENTNPRGIWRGIKPLTDYKYKTTLVSEEEEQTPTRLLALMGCRAVY